MAQRYLRATCGVGAAPPNPQLQNQLLDRGPRVASDVWVRVVDLTTKLAANHTVGNTNLNMHVHLCKLNARMIRLHYRKNVVFPRAASIATISRRTSKDTEPGAKPTDQVENGHLKRNRAEQHLSDYLTFRLTISGLRWLNTRYASRNTFLISEFLRVFRRERFRSLCATKLFLALSECCSLSNLRQKCSCYQTTAQF